MNTETMSVQTRKKCIVLFTIAVSVIALADGLSTSIFSNYFKDVFNVTAQQRGFLETPRESGGILCVVLFSLLGFLGDASLGVLSQILVAAGLLVLGFLQPTYGVMVGFLFLCSMGQHLFMPVTDSIGMRLAEKGAEGVSLGHFKKYSSLFAMIAGGLVFVGFRFGWFSFNTPVILSFAIAMVLNLTAAVLLFLLKREIPKKAVKNRGFVVRREYLPYYITTFAYGCQKRIRIVFGPWILIELLSQGADTLALLMLVTRFAASVVSPRVGRFIDKRGLKLSMRMEAAYMALVFVFQGLLAQGLATGNLQGNLWFWVACVGYILTGLTDQCQMVHSVLLKRLAGDRQEDVSISLSMGISVDHVMAIVISPILGLVWTGLGPIWVFLFATVSVVVQLLVSQKLREPVQA